MGEQSPVEPNPDTETSSESLSQYIEEMTTAAAEATATGGYFARVLRPIRFTDHRTPEDEESKKLIANQLQAHFGPLYPEDGRVMRTFQVELKEGIKAKDFGDDVYCLDVTTLYMRPNPNPAPRPPTGPGGPGDIGLSLVR